MILKLSALSALLLLWAFIRSRRTSRGKTWVPKKGGCGWATPDSRDWQTRDAVELRANRARTRVTI